MMRRKPGGLRGLLRHRDRRSGPHLRACLYAGVVSRIKKLMASTKGESRRAISNLIVKALRAHAPRSRYHAGTMAGVMLLPRRGLSGRRLDRLVLSAPK
jgi:hypothetical protein